MKTMKLVLLISLIAMPSMAKIVSSDLLADKSSFSIYQVNANKVKNAQQAARIVKNRFGGKVLKVQSTKVNGNKGFRVKLLKNNGHVVSVVVNARTGRVSGK